MRKQDIELQIITELQILWKKQKTYSKTTVALIEMEETLSNKDSELAKKILS